MSISSALQEESCTPVCGCVCGCVCVWVCVCVGVNIKLCVHCIRAASRILDQGGGNEKCRWGEVIRIICLLMNLTDPGGALGPPPQCSPVQYVRVTSVNCI